MLCALGLIAWSCSADEHDFDRASQLGDAGDGGEPAIAGAGGADTTVNGGAGAEAAGGTVSEAGRASSSQDLIVVSTSPEDGATGIERDAVIEVTFSAALDVTSVAAQSFKVSGPAGPMDGKLSVKGATVTFTPSASYALLADYTVAIAANVGAEQGGELGEAYEFGFQSRDGTFGKPVRLTTQATINLKLVGNRLGHAAAAWSDDTTPSNSFAALFDPVTGSWGETAALENDNVNDHTFVSIAINASGQAYAVTGNTVASWNRAEGGDWAAASMSGIAQRRSCALADDGTAMTVWDEVVGEDWRCAGASQSPANKWSATTILQDKARSWGVVSYGTGFLAFHAREPNAQMFSRAYEAARGWLPAKPITPADSGANYVSYATLAPDALFAWNDAKGRMQASLFDGDTWVTQELGPVAGATNSSMGPRGHLVTWPHINSVYAARYDLELGWGDAIKLGSTLLEYPGPGASVDDAGNALAVWAEGTAVAWRRSPNGAPWLDAQQIEDQDPDAVFSIGAASGEVMVIWSNPLGVWASRFE